MSADHDAPALVLEGRRVGRRPQGTARALGRATMLSYIALCASWLAVSLVWDTPGHWSSPALGFASLALLALTAVTVVTQLWCWIAPKSLGSLAIDARGLHLRRGAGGARTVPLERVESGWVLRDAAGPEVELRLRNGDVITTSATTPEEAGAVLDAAGVDASKRALTMQLGGAALNVAIVAGAAVPSFFGAACVASVISSLIGLPSVALGFLIFTLWALCVPLSLRAFAPPEVQVGSDGVSVRGGFKRWFLSYEQIASVALRTNDVVLVLRDGSARTISGIGTAQVRREVLVERITQGIKDHWAPRDLSARLAALDRNGRSLGQWSEALRDAVSEREDFRRAGLTRDEVSDALADPRSSPERRIGAAFALAKADKAQATERVRVAAATIADERVRVALERAAEGELDEALREADRREER